MVYNSFSSRFVSHLHSGHRRRNNLEGHDIRELGWTGTASSSCASSRRRPCSGLPLQHNRVSRHSLRPFEPSILQRMRHLRDSGFHLRQRGSGVSELQHLRSQGNGTPKEHDHRPKPERSESKHRNFNTRLPNIGDLRSTIVQHL